MKVVYIAGPFTASTSWKIEQNIRAAEEVGLMVAKMGAMPLIPHTNTRFFHGECTPDFWYKGTLELLKRCDAIIMLPKWNESSGSRAEHQYAHEHNIPTFYCTDQGFSQIHLPNNNRITLGEWIKDATK